MDVCETPNSYEVGVALPGVRPEDIELTVDQNTLTIRGGYSHQQEHESQMQAGQHNGGPTQHMQGKRQGHNWLSREIVSGTFERMVTFPRLIDTNAIQTNFQDGLLTIRVPVSEVNRPKRINITAGQGQGQQIPVGVGQQQR